MSRDMVRIEVHVTADDIAHGRRSDCTRCPVALAVGRAMGEPCNVTAYSIYTESRIALTPPAAARFIEAFDDLVDVKPFSFCVNMIGDPEGGAYRSATMGLL